MDTWPFCIPSAIHFPSGEKTTLCTPLAGASASRFIGARFANPKSEDRRTRLRGGASTDEKRVSRPNQSAWESRRFFFLVRCSIFERSRRLQPSREVCHPVKTSLRGMPPSVHQRFRSDVGWAVATTRPYERYSQRRRRACRQARRPRRPCNPNGAGCWWIPARTRPTLSRFRRRFRCKVGFHPWKREPISRRRDGHAKRWERPGWPGSRAGPCDRFPTGQPQAIGRECQITDPSLVTSKVSDRGAVGETPYPDVTVIATGDEFPSSTIECQAGNERGMIRKHVHSFEPRRFENMNFGSEGAARQILRVRAEGETQNHSHSRRGQSRDQAAGQSSRRRFGPYC